MTDDRRIVSDERLAATLRPIQYPLRPIGDAPMAAPDRDQEPTDDRIDADLRLDGFDPDEHYPEHGHDALRTAYRSGWESAMIAVRAHDRQADTVQGDPEALARRFHETYEALAPTFGYETRRASAVPWEDVPEQNKRLMIAVCAELTGEIPGRQADDVPVSRELLQRLTLPFDTHSLALFFAQVEARNLLDAGNPSDE